MNTSTDNLFKVIQEKRNQGTPKPEIIVQLIDNYGFNKNDAQVFVDQIDKTRLNKSTKGLTGWLILIGIQIILAPLIILNQLFIYQEISIKSALTIPIFAMIGNSLIFILSLYLIYLYFTKNKLFPKVYIAQSIFSILMITANISYLSSVSHISLMTITVDGQFIIKPILTGAFSILGTIGSLIQSILAAFIWIPYIVLSERVKNTFTES